MVSLFELKKRILLKQLARAEEKAQKAYFKEEKEKQLRAIRKAIKAQKISSVFANKAVNNAKNLKKFSKGLTVGLKGLVRTANLLEQKALKQNTSSFKRMKTKKKTKKKKK